MDMSFWIIFHIFGRVLLFVVSSGSDLFLYGRIVILKVKQDFVQNMRMQDFEKKKF